MLRSFFAVCSIQVALSGIALFCAGRRLPWPRTNARLGPSAAAFAVSLSTAIVTGFVARALWPLPVGWFIAAELYVVAAAALVIFLRPDWNAVGQMFFSAYAAAALTYLGYATWVTARANIDVGLRAGSAFLLLLELAALLLSSSFTFETCDVMCRTRRSRSDAVSDPSYMPMVSLHIPAYNEPPEMLIETIRAAEKLDYPNFEIVVIDNNTADPLVYEPVREYCRGRERVRFVHVSPWPGYKSGALNLAVAALTDPAAEILGVIDADYLVDPDYLRRTVGYFCDPRVAIVQTPQDYRDYETSRYLTACYDAYRYFFAMAMPSRHERDSIIFAGTMGLIRRRALEQVGGWDEWCITEDADASLRMLELGWSGVFVPESFGRGLMPLDFASLKRQRFRWCFGGMQILRRHWRTLLPWYPGRRDSLSFGQRLDYLLGSLQWLNDALSLGFALVLMSAVGLVLSHHSSSIRPLFGATLLLPAVLLASGLLRALWALRQYEPLSYGRSLLAFANWLSLSWVVALACWRGLFSDHGVFLRTPKTNRRQGVRTALRAARNETVLAGVLLASAGVVAFTTRVSILFVAMLIWQGILYSCAPMMSLLSQRSAVTRVHRRRQSRPVVVPQPQPGSLFSADLMPPGLLGVSLPWRTTAPVPEPDPVGAGS